MLDSVAAEEILNHFLQQQCPILSTSRPARKKKTEHATPTAAMAMMGYFLAI